MNRAEKIAHEYAILMRDLIGIRDAYLIRIMKNKRLPLSERYAALMHYYMGNSPIPPSALSDDSMIEHINDAIIDYEQKL